MIARWMLPHLPARPGGRRAADPAEVVGSICYKLKIGCQWRWLPTKALFTGQPLTKNGGAIVYQGRKAGRTVSALFLADNQGLPLAVATPRVSNRHTAFE